MSTTLSMWLGIAFVGLGIIAVVLQAWLWNPKYWDEVAKKTHAPKAGLRLHRWVGIAFLAIYLVMMWHMLPRLWQYQVELPARTVVHALAGIVLGILLLTKLAILRWFRHFEESMPALGFGILLCTLVLGTLSIPYAVRAQGLGSDVMSEENVARVRRLLDGVAFGDGVDRDDLVTLKGLDRGRKVLVEQCTACHDMRTILARPRTADAWFDVSARMAEKPSVFGAPIAEEDLPYVAAYLTAITPELQASRKREKAEAQAREGMMAAMMDAPPPAAAPTVAPASAAVDAKAVLQKNCTQCHELGEIDQHGPDDATGWTKVVRDMIAEGADISEADGKVIVDLLAREHGKS
jgi:cytochrome c5